MAVLTEEQIMLRDVARSWSQEKSPVSALRRIRNEKVSGRFDAALWKDIAEMGWAGILIPESLGGVELGYASLGLVLEETGRTLTASPLISTALGAASALLIAGNAEQKRRWLPEIAQGTTIGALAFDEVAHHSPSHVATTATASVSGWKLDGNKSFVLDGASAGFFVVSARTDDVGKHEPVGRDTAGIVLFLVPADRAGISIRERQMADSRGMADVRFNSVDIGSADVLGSIDNGYATLQQILDYMRVGLAAEMLGSAAQAFDTTLEYLKTRTQFGQPIGSFQALQHRAAKMFVDLELTRSCVEAALQAIDQDSPQVAQFASLAKAKANDLFHLVSNEMVQLHGGIGMTDEHDAGFYLKRSRVAEALFGNSAFHRDRYARLLEF